MAYYWICHGQDDYHGCFSADFEGICMARSRKSFKTETAALEAGKKHRCKFRSKVMIFKKRGS